MSGKEYRSIDERIIEAQELINIHHDYDSAEELFLSVVEEDPDDDRGWYGLLRACTCRFDAVEFLIEKHGQKIPERFTSYYEKACDTANAKNREIIRKRWELFVGDYQELYEMCAAKKKRRKEELKNYGKPRDEEDEEEVEEDKSSGSGGSSSGFLDGCLEFIGFLLVVIIVILVLAKVAGSQ